MNYRTMFGPVERSNNYGRAIWVLLTIAIAVSGLSGSLNMSAANTHRHNEGVHPGYQCVPLCGHDLRPPLETGRSNHPTTL
ncbi:MAG: hypothetical protein AAF940_03455 [Pseudomonadota bacterium]